MLRKTIRKRKEYLFSKEKTRANKDKIEKKKQLKQAYDNNTKIATELYRDEEKLQESLAYDDTNTLVQRTHVDDEYEVDRYTEPKIMLTSSRKPSQRLIQFQKEINLMFPNAVRFNRGAYKIKDLVNVSEKKGFTDIVLVHEHRGEPDGLIICHMPIGPTIYFGI